MLFKKEFLIVACIFTCVESSFASVEAPGMLLPDVMQYQAATVKMVAQAAENSLSISPLGKEWGRFCINGSQEFTQKVLQASHARPVAVVFFAWREELWQGVLPQLLPLAKQQEDEKQLDFVAVDIYQKICVEDDQAKIVIEDDQNYKIAMECMKTVQLPGAPLPVVVFFKDGLMCSSPQAILSGKVTSVMVQQVAKLFVAKR